jgi:hypothetical protein
MLPDQLTSTLAVFAAVINTGCFLRAHDHAQNSAALTYHDAGHGIAFPFIPVAPRLSLGGTPAGLARADQESWRAVVGFLDRALARQ